MRVSLEDRAVYDSLYICINVRILLYLLNALRPIQTVCSMTCFAPSDF